MYESDSTDYTQLFKYTKVDTEIDLPFDLYIDKNKKVKKRKIILPSWLGFLVVNRKNLFNFLKRSINIRKSDPEPYDKLIKSIIDEVEKLD